MRYETVTVMTRNGTMHCVDDTLTGKNSVCTNRNRYEAELEAMSLNCESELKKIELYSPWLDSSWC